MIKKLRIKFVCINMTFITIMLVFIMLTVIQFTKLNIEQNSIQMMNNLASNPLHIIRPNGNTEVGLPYFTLRINENNELLDSVSNYYNLSDPTYFHDVLKASAGISGKTGELPEYNLRFMRVTTPVDEFLIFVEISHEITTISTLTQNCLLIGFFSFFIFLIISILFANWAIKPVEKAWSQQQQFIADASHELKTPLTVILTNVELLQSTDYEKESKLRFSNNILTMATQMRNLVNGLLELSRVEDGSLKTSMEQLDFSLLTEHSVFLLEPLFFENDRRLDYHLTRGLSLIGSETHLKQVIEILLDNALKYSSPQTTVSVKLQKQKKYCHLTVSNYGATISQDDLTNIFKRFYRTDKSRTSSGSYGLGLPIAQNIILEHKGKIWAESLEHKNIFHILLPLSKV